MKQLELEKRLQGLAKELESSKLLEACIELTTNYGEIIGEKKIGSTETSREYSILNYQIIYRIFGHDSETLQVFNSNLRSAKELLLDATKIDSPEICGIFLSLEVNYKGKNFVVRKYIKGDSNNNWESVILKEYKRANREVEQQHLDHLKENFPSVLGPKYSGEEQ